ncbi:MAG TPA: oxidoreductase [Planctomycetaceae bacterium]|nr:oxidoreductase [Planctomycetaceae bacterium]
MEPEWFSDRNQQLFGISRPVAMVTGSAADRVGRKVAMTFFERQFNVVFHAHTDNAQDNQWIDSLDSSNRQVLRVSGPVEQPESCQRWLDQIMAKWGRIDVMVNSAAIWQPKPLEQTELTDLRQHIEVNLLGSFLTSQRFGLQMAGQSGGGAIVQIGDWAVQRPYSGFSAYFLSKGGIGTLTRSLAVELASRNPKIRVNAVLPGPVMLAEGVGQQQSQRIEQDCLLKRAGTAQDVAEAVYFLATSPFITGVCLPVDGGRSIFSGPMSDSIAHPDYDPTSG